MLLLIFLLLKGMDTCFYWKLKNNQCQMAVLFNTLCLRIQVNAIVSAFEDFNAQLTYQHPHLQSLCRLLAKQTQRMSSTFCQGYKRSLYWFYQSRGWNDQNSKWKIRIGYIDLLQYISSIFFMFKANNFHLRSPCRLWFITFRTPQWYVSVSIIKWQSLCAWVSVFTVYECWIMPMTVPSHATSDNAS